MYYFKITSFKKALTTNIVLPKWGQTVINSTLVFQFGCGARAEHLSLEVQPSATPVRYLTG
jgi:hypothetical protein